MIRKTIFTIVWTIVFCFGSQAIGSFYSIFFFVREFSSGGEIYESGTLDESFFMLATLVPMLCGSIGLILGVFGKLPGTRLQQTTDDVIATEQCSGSAPEKSCSIEGNVRKAKVVMIVVGAVSILMAAFGLWYNLQPLFNRSIDLSHREDVSYFYPAFYTMSAICIGCYIVLLICGVQFIRLRIGLLRLFVGTIIFEVVYFFFSIGAIPVFRNIEGVVAASNIVNGGLMIQALILFPLWAPGVAAWAANRIPKP
jgi:hypothetical protein